MIRIKVSIAFDQLDADLFDLLCHLAFNAPVLTRRQRAKCRAGFVMAISTRTAHSCSMKITEDVHKSAAEPGIAEKEALKRVMEAKSKSFVEKGADLFAKA